MHRIALKNWKHSHLDKKGGSGCVREFAELTLLKNKDILNFSFNCPIAVKGE